MKAYQRGDKIVIRKDEEYKEIEWEINRLIIEIEKLKAICEDRTTEDFPVEIIRRIIQKWNVLRNKGENIKISDSYFRFVNENKNIAEYFESQLSKIENEKTSFINKADYLKRFSKILE